ncbi:MAG: hypothetical protein M5U19_21635 [Microthrixaceae bacterium]|nr:hypothetical protein [Microthrixaceae bacterium]
MTLVVVSALCLVAAGTSLAADAPVQAAGFAAVTCVAGWLSVVLHRRRAAVDRPRPDVPPAPEEPARYPDRPGPTGEQTLYQDHQDALAAQESLLAEWNLWRAQAGLPQTPSPQDCVELLDRVRSARTAAEAHRTTTGAIADVAGEIERHRRAVAEVLALAGTDPRIGQRPWPPCSRR